MLGGLVLTAYYKNLYYLFTGEQHKDIRLSFSKGTVEKFIDCWNKGYSPELIQKETKLKPTEISLLIIDLNIAGKIDTRPGAFFGTVSKVGEKN